jgi:serine/threonine protein kinase/tetratricopeptide (TPR) repeat protein
LETIEFAYGEVVRAMKERDIFVAALAITTAEKREAFLNEACSEPGQKEQLKALLEAEAKLGTFLESPARPAASARVDEGPGAIIGAYKLLEQIGEGGMGVVFMAEQTRTVHRKVALKVIKPGMDTRQVIARFEAERQALALMDHPNIAKLFDAGTTGQARKSEIRNPTEKSETRNPKSEANPKDQIRNPKREHRNPEGEDVAAADPDLGFNASQFEFPSNFGFRSSDLKAGSPDFDPGRPYFVMELVRGVPITDYCDKNRLDAEARLRLFVTVCLAIQHAHQKGIIHRDIKPSNVMVTLNDGQPVAKVIDFGIAKATEQKLTERTLFTAYGEMIGTPAYMSPEQAEMASADVDTRSDIYSLGVLLYQLMTGTTPIDDARLRTAGFSEIQRLIREVTPPRPSSRLSTLGDSATVLAGNRGTDPKRLAKLLAGDLDWIMMKALEKDRDRRYATAGEFAADIERFLRHEGVVARPPSAAYRLATFVRRYRGAVVAATVTIATLLAGTTIAIWQAIVATRAKHDALAAATAERLAKQVAVAKEAETQAVFKFVQDHILAAARPKGWSGGLGPEVTLRAAIEAAVPFVEPGFKDQPLTEARVRMTLGDSFWLLGDGKAAGAQYEPARDILTSALGPQHPDTLQCLIDLGISYQLQGRIRESIKLYESVLPVCKAKFGPHAPQTLQCMNNLAMGLFESGDFQAANQIHREALAISEARYGPDDRRTLRTMINLANVYEAMIRYDEALELREQTIKRFHSRYSRDDVDCLMAMHNLGQSYRLLGRYADALRLDEETRSRRRTVLGVDHPDTLASLWSVADDLIKLHRGPEGMPLLDECLTRAVGKRVHPFFLQAADLRLRYFQKAMSPDQCRLTAELWEKQERADASSLYQAALCRAVTAGVLKAATPPDARRERLVKTEADLAMAWLQKAVAAGFNDKDRLEFGKDFDSVRDRADFRKLMAELEAKKH